MIIYFVQYTLTVKPRFTAPRFTANPGNICTVTIGASGHALGSITDHTPGIISLTNSPFLPGDPREFGAVELEYG